MAKRVAAVLLLAITGIGPARADDPDCARFEDPLAYNACLARHGPKAGAVAKGSQATVAPSGVAIQPALKVIGAAPRDRPRRVDRPHGRIHMEFELR